MKELVRSKKFRVRLVVSLGILAVVVAGFLTPDAALLRTVFIGAAGLAALETMAFTMMPATEQGWFTEWGPTIMICFVVVGAAGMLFLPVPLVFACMVVTYGSDAAAYLFGSLFGKKSRKPFPKISPNKTVVGTVAGVATGLMLALGLGIYLAAKPPAGLSDGERQTMTVTLYVLMAGGVLGMFGDLFESALKRRFAVKDSCEILRCLRGFGFVERLLGGSDGHGGYLDRIDSLSVTMTVTYLVYSIARN